MGYATRLRSGGMLAYRVLGDIIMRLFVGIACTKRNKRKLIYRVSYRCLLTSFSDAMCGYPDCAGSRKMIDGLY